MHNKKKERTLIMRVFKSGEIKMQKIIDDFVLSMEQEGMAPSHPSDIKADDKRRDYHISGDAKHKKKGYYRLKIEGEFGVGFFGDYRTDECKSWYSKPDRKISPGEMSAINERIKLQREQHEAEQKEAWDKAAVAAQDFLLFISDCTEHPYLSKKQVNPYGLFISGDGLIIPMTDGYEICNYQEIKPDGTKLFLKGAKKQGAWFEITGDDTILICEGYATGASLHKATGHTIVVAFDAGNLVAVAPKIKEKYPKSTIIICADNDHETIDRKTGKNRNTGLIKGKEAAALISCRLVYPEFKNPEGLTDFNDLHVTEGLQAVRDKVSGKAEIAPAGVLNPQIDNSQARGGELIQDDWMSGLQRDKGENLVQRSTTNILLVTANDARLNGVFKYDSFAKRIIVYKCPPWENEQIFNVRPLHDYDYIRLESYLESQWGLKASKDKCADAIDSSAKLPKNTVNPASDYFNGLKWDNIPRLGDWLKKYVSDGKQPDNYLTMVGIKFMCGLAARAMTPGVKFDTMVILEGKQYAGKSYLSRIIATIEGEEYFLDDFKEIENKDALMKLQGKLVVEFPEISTMRRAEVNDLKAFLSRTSDVFRPPYGRNTMESGRQCVFIGTVNPEGPYLRDVTGNRRYWPISCRNKLDLENLKKIMPHLHAEAAHLVKNGELLYLNDTEYDLATIEQDKRVMTDIWVDKVNEIIGSRTEIATDDILFEMNIPVERRNQVVYNRLMHTMISLGFVSDRVGSGKNRRRGFVKIGTQESFNDINEEIPW